jgi:hypothetical protein
MTPSDLPYTDEEEIIAEQIARNSDLVAECERHPGTYYRAYSAARTIEKIDEALLTNADKLLALIKRNELQKKALIMLALRKYGEKCAQCLVH